jgi:DNA-binding response OmpR family regulator
VITVADLPRAVAYLDEEFAKGRSDALPDVIVADVPPWGPEHLASISLLRRLSRRLPVVAMTDLGESAAFMGGERFALLEVIEKPIDAAALRAAVLRVQARQFLH